MKEKIICGIYIIESPTGRIYVGQSRNIYSRWRSHKRITTQLISKSIQKYGVEKHKFLIVCECKLEELTQNEIKFYNHYKDLGYNLLNTTAPKTTDSFGHNEITKLKIAKGLRGQTHSEETKRKRNESLKISMRNPDKIEAARQRFMSISNDVHIQQKSRISQINRWTPELRARKSEITKAYWTPERRAAKAEITRQYFIKKKQHGS